MWDVPKNKAMQLLMHPQPSARTHFMQQVTKKTEISLKALMPVVDIDNGLMGTLILKYKN